MGHRVAETTRNANAFGTGTANKHTVQWWFKKFCKGDKSPEDEEHSVQPSEVDNDQLWGSLMLILLQPHEKLPKNSTSTIQRLVWHLKQIRKMKILISGCIMSWQKQKTKHCFEVSSFLILCNNEPFLKRTVTCDEKWIVYDNQRWPAQGLNWEEAAKHFPKPILYPEKMEVTV